MLRLFSADKIIVDRKGIAGESLIGTQDFQEKEMNDKLASFVKA